MTGSRISRCPYGALRIHGSGGRLHIGPHRSGWRVSGTDRDHVALGVPRQTATLSAPFILANSAVGLAGALYVGQHPSGHTWLYAVGALAGAIVGGLRWFSQTATRLVLAAVLGIAGVQLLFSGFHLF
jgi:hypothetical protein